MADYDSKSTCKTVNIITPVVLAADNTPAAVDLAGFRSAIIQTNVGIGGITFSATDKIEIKLFHGSTSVYASATAVAAEDVVMPYGESWATGGIIRSLIAAKAAADTEVHTVGYIGKERYVFVLVDFSGTHGAGTPIAISAVLGHSDVNPIWQSSIEV
jgi:hypothetical protein